MDAKNVLKVRSVVSDDVQPVEEVRVFVVASDAEVAWVVLR